MLWWCLSVLRALCEMLGLCLLGQVTVGLLAGQRRQGNPIYQLFALVTRPPRQIVGKILRRDPNDGIVRGVTFILVLLLWLGIAFFRIKA